MKKLIFTAAALAAFGLTAYAAQPGEVLGLVYTTDILTVVDNVPIPSYSIDGTTAVALADLRGYGFDVQFNEETRRVDVTTLEAPQEYNTPAVERGSVGGTCGEVLSTDIVAYVNGIFIPSYNVNGRTCVEVEALGAITDKYNEEWGYSDYNFNYRYDNSVRTLYLNSFRFPATTMEKVVEEYGAFSADNEFELYTHVSGQGNKRYYSGARLEPETGIYAGITADETEGFTDTFGVYSSYFEFDERNDDFKKNYKSEIEGKDCINLICWNTMDVTQAYDDEYIRRTLDNITAAGQKAIIRYGAEMNMGTMGNSPSAFVKAFRHIADIVHEYDNLAMMWSPGDYGSLDRPYELYYPGNEYVDWVGMSCFMKHDFMGITDMSDEGLLAFNCGDYAWMSNSIKKLTDFMQRNNIDKPIAISEGAVESKVLYADIDLTGWAEQRLRAMYWYTAMKFPQVKMFTYFNQNCGGEIMEYKTTPEYREIINEAIDGAGYLTTASGKPEKTFCKANSSNQRYENGTMPLYAYAYFPHENILRVEYEVDGVIKAVSENVPYYANITDLPYSGNLIVRVVTDKDVHEYQYYFQFRSGAYYLS
ncbi:MAG: glycosyl hydrolase [bacterium]|nr:glycosyl hydrolase [bacterium]